MSRPKCWNFAMDFLGPPEAPKVIEYVEQLEKEIEALKSGLLPLARIPVEAFDKQDRPDYPLMAWNNHKIYVRDVLAARELYERKL